MAEKAEEAMARIARTRVPSPTDVAVAAFHQGAHPQRPIPNDLTDEEKGFLDQERARIHAPNRVPDDEPGIGAALVNPDRPNQGVLFSGATAREEALLAGIDPKVLDTIEEERAERLKSAEVAAEKAQQARAEQRSAAEPTPIKK